MLRRQFLQLVPIAATVLIGHRSLRAAKPAPAAAKPLFTALGVAAPLARHAELKAAGADYVEDTVSSLLMPDKDDQAFAASIALARQARIPARACNIFLPGSHRATGPDAQHPKVLAYAEIAFARARALGVKTIVFGSSGARRLPDGFSKVQATAQFVSLLRQMGPLAAAQGVTVAIEPLNTREDNFLNTVAEGAAIVQAVGHPGIGLTADIYHMMRNGETPADLLRAAPRVTHVHIAENEKRSAPGVAGDDFAPYFAALRSGGYSGPISIEANDWSIEQLAQGFQTIRRFEAATA